MATPEPPRAPGPENPRRVLARYGLNAKKSWGQNFLVDRRVLQRIVAAAAPGDAAAAVEIGAGLGTLTLALLGADRPPRRLLAIERDPDLLAVLRAELAGRPEVEIRAEDAAHFDFAAAARAAGGPLAVVGNLPYQLSSVLLFALADAGAAVARATVMVQREFAARVVAAPGSKIYGRLSVMMQQRMETRLLFHVPPGAFFPRPAVVSSLLSLVPRTAPLAPVADDRLFAEVVKASFAARRKMLRRSLADAFGDAAAATALAHAGLDGRARPEELPVAAFAGLADGLATASVHREQKG